MGPHTLFAWASKCLGVWFISFWQIRSTLYPRITSTKGSSYSICPALFLESSYVMTITNYVIMTQLRIYQWLTGWLGGAGGFLGNIFWIELIQLFWSVGSRAINKRSTAWSWSNVALHFGIFEWSLFYVQNKPLIEKFWKQNAKQQDRHRVRFLETKSRPQFNMRRFWILFRRCDALTFYFLQGFFNVG